MTKDELREVIRQMLNGIIDAEDSMHLDFDLTRSEMSDICLDLSDDFRY